MSPTRPTLRAAAPGACLCALALLACGDNGPMQPDANLTGPCPTGEVFYTGELVDWVSTPATFRGVFDASFTVDGDAARTDQTSPNGRFELCLANAASTRVLIDATADSTYQDGVAVVDLDVLKAGVTMSLRSFTTMQEAGFTPRLAPGKAHVFIDVAGAARAITLSAAYEAAFAFDGTQWVAGTSGRAVFFANVEPGAAAKATMSGRFVGGASVPREADRLSFVTVVGQ
ncbi:MAG: hypothetical protein R3B48_01575 [Kofleriaceae bacterium]